jgi:flagellar biogenesis protein FliO
MVMSEPVFLSNTLSLATFWLFASIASSGAILAIVLTYSWILRKVLQADEEQP